MTILFAGGELSSFAPSDIVNVTEVTTTQRDTAYTRSAIAVAVAAGWADGTFVASATTAWLHFEWSPIATTGGNPIVTLYNATGTAVFRLHVSASSTLQMQYWNGSAWTNIGATLAFTSNNRVTFDMKVVCGASGSAALYTSGTLVASGSASMTSVDNIAKVRLSTSSSPSYWSQIIAADESTIGWKLATLAPSANGANTTWTNDYTAIDEATTVDDADFISSTTADQVETFATTDAAATGFAVKAVVVAARAKLAATGPQNLQMAVRSAGTNYFSGNVSGLGAGFAPVQAVFNTDPATGAAWSIANVNNAEIGVKSVA